MIDQIIRDRELRLKNLKVFWNSEKLDKMVNTIIESNNIISTEGWSYGESHRH
jgi:hypothetical protein